MTVDAASGHSKSGTVKYMRVCVCVCEIARVHECVDTMASRPFFVADSTLYRFDIYPPRTAGDGVVVASQALGVRIEIGWLISSNSDDQVACVSVSSIHSLFSLHTDVLCINCQVRLQEGKILLVALSAQRHARNLPT